MTNKPPRFIWKWCWKFISPLAILTVLVISIEMMSEGTPSYSRWDKTTGKLVSTPYPIWTVFCAICLILVSIFCIPAVAFLRFFRFIPLGTNELPLTDLGNYFPDRKLSYQRQPNNGEREQHRRSPIVVKKAKSKLIHTRKSPNNTNGRVPHYPMNEEMYLIVGQHNGNAPML